MALSPTSSRGSSGTSSPITSASLTLTDAQIKTLPTAGVTIVGAPGASLAILPVSGVMVAHFPDGGYVGGANDYFTIGTGTDAAEEMGAIARGLTNGAVVPLLPGISATASLGFTPTVNQSGAQLSNEALTISASASGNWTGGGAGNSLYVKVLYLVISV